MLNKWATGLIACYTHDQQYHYLNKDGEEVESAVREEMEGPGQLLGYRTMQRKVREQYQLPLSA